MAIVADRTTPCDDADFPPVPYNDRAWDEDDDHITPSDAVLLYRRTQELRFFELLDDASLPDDRWDDTRTEAPETVPPLTPDELDAMPDGDEEAWARMIIERSLPAIRGGSPDADRPEPTDADAADFEAWLDSLDATTAPVDQVELPPPPTSDNINRYSPDSLRVFRRTAWGV